ncbi:uncharacterized protein ACB057_015636 [Neosynchiropus ocellatus]
MSIEYTIDLQLTELGFPDILLPDKACDPPGLSPEPSAEHHKRAGTGAGTAEESDAGPGPESDSDSSDASEADDDERAESGAPGSYKCSACRLQLSSKSALLEHLTQYSGSHYSCRRCRKTFTQVNSYRLHQRTHAKAPAKFFCRICRVSYSSQKDLKAHLATTHLENKFYECDNCKHVFTSLQACQKHVELRTCVEELHCKVCQQSFTSRTVYQQHRRTTCVFTYRCTVCLKTFSRKNTLLRHSFTHLGCLPYTCISCSTHFTKASLYHAHKCKRNPIKCRACLREFANGADFQQHIHDTGCWGNQELKKDAIRCLECGKRFETSEELKQHSSAHQKVLRCAECGKGFRSALLLMSHMGGHAGATPCLCQSCGLGFPHQQNFGSHLKTCGQEPKLGSKSKKQQVSDDSKADPVSVSPSPLSEAAMTGGDSDGCWKLTLDKDPPPGANLVLFLPVQVQPTGDATDPGAPQDHPVNPDDQPQRDPDQDAPLDLLDATEPTSNDVSVPPIKNEPEESEISGSASAPPAGYGAEAPALTSRVKDEPESPMDSEMS